MADSRFALSNQNIVEQLKENAKIKNMLRATQTWLNVWQTWATERKLKPKLVEYEHEQLDIYTKDGFEYEPESLKSMLAALDCYLKDHDYKYSNIRDREFHQSKLVLEGNIKCLHQQGKGKRPNAANALTTEEEEMLWSKQSLGNCNPRVLSQTMWWILAQHFGLRRRQDYHSMCNFENFQTSLVPINHEMHSRSRSYDFLYVSYKSWRGSKSEAVRAVAKQVFKL